MSSVELRIEDWVRAEDVDPRRAFTAAEFIFLVDGVPATRLLDSWSRTVTDRARLPLYPMAEWFASNWWRLHYEPPYEGDAHPPTRWRLSHDLPAIGAGFIWPRLRFASDDRSMQISARALKNASWEPVQHLNDVQPPRSIDLNSFDVVIEEFISVVLRRLNDLGISAEPLLTIWSDVVAERADPEVKEWRKWEARLGFDPDEASDSIMQDVSDLSEQVGSYAAAEVVPLLTSRNRSSIRQLNRLAVAAGVEATLPLKNSGFEASFDMTPWDAGRHLAHLVRSDVGQTTGPLQDSALFGLLGTRRNAFEHTPPRDVPLGLGVYFPNLDKTVLHFRKLNLPGRRFEAARFIAESVSVREGDLWLPLTDRGTARQKFQRAFAAEFLIPIAEISEEVGELRTSERFEHVAERYGVSPLAVQSHLANCGLLSPEEVSA